MKDKTFIALSGIFFLLFFMAVAALTLNKPLSSILKAKNTAPSPLKSFGVAFPQVGNIGNSSTGEQATKIRVSVYIRGVDGSILDNRNVQLSAQPSIVTIEPANTAVTNNIGQAEFYISSHQAGKIKLTATELASKITINNIPTVEFVP